MNREFSPLSKLSYDFDMASRNIGNADIQELLLRILPRNQAAFNAFEHALKSKDWALRQAAIMDDKHSEVLLSGYGQADKNRLARKAALNIFLHFTANDYTKLSLQQQKLIVHLFLHEKDVMDQFNPGWSSSVQLLLNQTAHIPQSLQQIHQYRMRTLHDLIVTDDFVAGTYEDLISEDAVQLTHAERKGMAALHLEILSAIYGVQMPKVKDYYDAVEAQRIKDHMAQHADEPLPPRDPNYRPAIMAFNYEANTLNPQFNACVYLNADNAVPPAFTDKNTSFPMCLSHEFAHHIEGVLMLADSDNDKFTGYQVPPQLYPKITKSHPLKDAQTILGLNSYYTTEGYYISNFQSYNLYHNQLAERHANWFGALCEQTIRHALEERQKNGRGMDSNVTSKCPVKRTLLRSPSFLK